MAQLKKMSGYEKTIDVFYGYNRNDRIFDGEFVELNNLTSSYYPLLATRHIRARFNSVEDPTGLFAKEKLIYISGDKLYYGGAEVPGIVLLPSETERQMVSMGAYLLIFPDKIYINTNDLNDFGSMGASFTTAAGATVTYYLCRADGASYDGYTVSETPPKNPGDGTLWLDTSAAPHSLKQYAAYTGLWVGIATTYVKIAYPNIGKAFKQYDGVKISGSFDGQFNTTTVIQAIGDDYIVVTGLIGSTKTQTSSLTVKREIPDMDFLCEGENRVWGCSSEKNEIYACKLGDFKNWNCFMGISTDSYAVSVGSDGEFTGAIRYLSSILFFKENYIHKIYNTNPPYSVTTSATKGVQKGSHKSLCVVNGKLFYLSPTGIRTYEGSLSSPVENVFGTDHYHSGKGGEFRNKYYICVSSSFDGVTQTLFVYDTQRGVWHKESSYGNTTKITGFVSHNSNLYFAGPSSLCLIDAEQPYGTFTGQLAGYGTESYVDWHAITGVLGLEYAGSKYIKAVSVRLSLMSTRSSSNPAYMKLYAQYDGDETLVLLDEAKEQNIHGFTIKANIPRRCDNMRLMLAGRGECRIYSITLSYEEGGEPG